MPTALSVPGVEIGHWTDAVARTGCTVIVLPPGTVASGEVRGGAPATRDFALLAPERLVECVDAVVLTGGSAFGLATADGVMTVLEAEGRGYRTAHGRVPIVVAMALYDLATGQATVRPGAVAGRHAATHRSGVSCTGAVGAGTGATVSKWLGADEAKPGGLGIASVRRGALVLSAVVAVNAAGSPDPAGEAILDKVAAGTFERWPQRVNPLADPRDQSGIRSESPADPSESPADPSESPADPSESPADPSESPADPTESPADPSDSPAGQSESPDGPTDSPEGTTNALANTTLCALVTNAALSKLDCFWVAQGGHDGLARALVPAHSRSDGDAVVAAATGRVPAEVDDVRLMAVAAVVKAVRSATTRSPL